MRKNCGDRARIIVYIENKIPVRRVFIICSVLALMLFSSAVVSHARTINLHVNTTAGSTNQDIIGSGCGQIVPAPCSLRWAINYANAELFVDSGDQVNIFFASPLFDSPQTIVLNSTIISIPVCSLTIFGTSGLTIAASSSF